MLVSHLRFALCCWAVFTVQVVQSAEVDYERDIKPILHERCYACHGALKQEGSLRLDTANSAKLGGDSGPSIEIGKPAESYLLQRITAEDESDRMPPEGQPLSPEQINLFKAWITAGAIGPENEQPEADPNEHWSFLPPQRPAVPKLTAKTKKTAWAKNPIDHFIAAQHQAKGLTRVASATPEVLLRRVYIDLIGLPPTRKQLREFLADPSEAAYKKIVDQLLDSPQYGERWGRHWMDVWRYSDWYGRRYVNDVRNSNPHIWRWRDWIICSLNADHGYDQMLQEMLAADELTPEDDETIVATGFLVRNWYSLNYDQWMRDTVEHTGKAFLGLRLNCALCHDHKYDPISQEEYFQMRAFFEPLELRQDRVPGGPDLPKYLKYKPGSGASLRPTEAGLARIYDHNLNAETFMYQGGDKRNLFEGRKPVPPGTPEILGGELNIQPVTLPPVAAYPGLKPWLKQDEIDLADKGIKSAQESLALVSEGENELAIVTANAKLRAAEQQLVAIQARIAADEVRLGGAKGDAKQLAQAASMAQRGAKLAMAQATLAEKEQALATAESAAKADEKDQKLKEGLATAKQALESAKQSVSAAEKAATKASDAYTSLAPQYPTESTGRRSALAKWITRDDHPLTPRVAVNHIWMRHFGQPLVESVNDFGRSGQLPSHPALLDWLAVELVEHDWQMKHLHRLIVTSGAYRMASSISPDPISTDPANVDPATKANLAQDQDNKYIWHFPLRRMEAEVIRDGVLHLAGQLDQTLGGPEIDRTEQEASRRRSLYFAIYPEEGGMLDFNALFDPPDPTDCYRRTDSIMPQQALATTNSQLVVQQGRILAGKLWAEVTAAQKPENTEGTKAAELQKAFIIAAFEQVLTRAPREAELNVCQQFLTKQVKLYQQNADALKKLSVTKSTDKPDTKLVAAQDPAVRARESFVRSLFSHTDFITLR